ncbi:hypothetical protein HX870_10200 [Pseudomonas gingeri]|uniref:hypothetical protein n=1 Tax=Pseudomonas gingeri TaxID=117681 RepID=UPI0015A1E553|nr:hypothetical protein [Pseudomonas gingeri]NWA29178.1 hypothetical protein [Pseudomonas gingeri]NWD67967.1 hypothetical protein [Pseudomonas gingeri]
MNRYTSVSAVSLVLLAAMLGSGCDKKESSPKQSFEMEKSVIGTWAEGEWSNSEPQNQAPPAFRILGETLIIDSCSFSTESLLSPTEKDAYLALKQAKACSVSLAPKSVILHRKGNCQALVELYASLSSVGNGVPEQSGIYTKVGCTETSAVPSQ